MRTTKPGLTIVDDVAGVTAGIDLASGPDVTAYTALTPTQSKTFRTLGGAVRWLAARGYRADGSRA
jgi:hypothetical protein